MADALSPAQLADAVPTGWSLEEGRLRRRFRFVDFGAAIAFMVRVALRCESMNHHPNWSNVYATVDVELWTHDADGITALDLELAAHMNAVAVDLAPEQ